MLHWLYLLFSIVLLAVSLRTASFALMVVCLLASLALLVAWVMAWYSSRVGDVRRDESMMIDPAELRRLREVAEARKLAANPPPGEPPPL